jgi:hypothetical protein
VLFVQLKKEAWLEKKLLVCWIDGNDKEDWMIVWWDQWEKWWDENTMMDEWLNLWDGWTIWCDKMRWGGWMNLAV